MTDIARPTTMHVDPMADGSNTTTPASVAVHDDSHPTDTPTNDAATKASNLHPVRRAQIIAECVRQGYYRTPSCNDKLHLHFKGYNSFEAHCLDDYTDCKVLWMEGNCFTDESFYSSVICTSEDKHLDEDNSAAGVNHPPTAHRRNKGDAPPVPVFEASPEGSITGGPNLLASQAPVLRSMYLHQNLLQTFPSIAAGCQRLDSLNISDNFITSLSRGGLVTPMWMWPSEILSALDDIIDDRKNKGAGVPIPDADVGCKIDASGLWNLFLNGKVDCVGLAHAARELAVQSIVDEKVRAAERNADEEVRMTRLMSYGKQLKKEADDATAEDGNAAKSEGEEETGTKVAAAALIATKVLCQEALEALSPIAKSIHSHHGVFGWVPLSIGMWDLVIKQIIMTEGLMLLPPPAAEEEEVAAENTSSQTTSPSKSRQKEEDDEASLGAFLTAMGGDAASATAGLTSDMMPAVENYGVTSRPEYLKRFRRACQFAVHLRNATYPFCVTALPGGGAVPKKKEDSTTTDDDDAASTLAISPPEALVNTLTWIQIKNNHLRNPIELLPLLLCARLSALDLSGNRIDDGDALLIFLEHTTSVGVREASTATNTDDNTASWVAPPTTANDDDNDSAAAASSTHEDDPSKRVLPASTPYYHLKSLMLHGNPAVRSITQYRKKVLSTVIGGFERGASMLGPEGGKAVPRGLSYLDDRPVFDNERRLVVAWAAGGLDGEKRERETIKHEEENAVQQRLKDFKSMMRRAAAAAGVTLNRSNSATASASSSLGGMITIEDDDDDDRPTSSDEDEDEDESSDGAAIQLSQNSNNTVGSATITRGGAVPDNKAPTPSSAAAVDNGGNAEEERSEFYRRNYAAGSAAAAAPPSNAPSASTDGVAWDEFAIRNNNTPTTTTTAPIPSMADQAAQRAQEAAGRRGIVIIDDVEDDEDDDEITTAP